MNAFPRIELRTLLEEHPVDCRCVSMYMPTYKGGYEVQQNPVRLKNLLRQAEERLAETGMRGADARRMLEPAQKLTEDSDFLRHQSDGLAIFIAPGFFRHYQIPHDFKELVLVSRRFHLKPLLPILSDDGRFYILALSHNRVRFMQCTHYGFQELELGEAIPASLPEFLKYDELDRQFQFHYHGSSTPGIVEISHGRDISDREKIDLLRYFQQIDRGLERQMLNNETAPLILAGVEELFPIYREANKYKNILEQGVTGNPDQLSAETLHKRGWDIAGPFFARARKTAVQRYREMAGTSRVSNDLERVLADSYYGMIDTLFVPNQFELWGTFDLDTRKIEQHAVPEPCDVDLLDLAAAHTLVNHGSVYVVTPEEVPGCLPVAAILRY